LPAAPTPPSTLSEREAAVAAKTILAKLEQERINDNRGADGVADFSVGVWRIQK
jgi:hypothetical protein